MIEKILIEINRLKNELDGYSAREALDYIESYINTLSKQQQEQPCEDLEEEIKRYGKEEMPVVLESDLNDIARHFAEWQKEQMGEQARKELAKTDITLADLVAFDEGLKLGRRLERQDMLKDAVEGVMIDSLRVQIMAPLNAVIQREGLKDGDKMKILIVKEDRVWPKKEEEK